jgi:flagellar basal body rod protein FlgC
VPLSKKGWQDAIEAAYPFKINLFRIQNGEATYIDIDPQRPLHVSDISLRADNIRNIHSTDQEYPSPFHADSVVFENGRMTIDGKANFLAEPFPGILATYQVQRIPLNKFEPETQRANLHVYQGTLKSTGLVEYSPKVARVEVENATIEGIHLDYVHTSQSAAGETSRIETVKTDAAEVNNAPGVQLKAHEIVLTHSEVKFINDAGNPHYRLAVSDMNLRATNLSNHLSAGPAKLRFGGKLMGSGDTTLTGVLRPEHQGPNFDFDLASSDTDLTSLNDLLRAYGKFDVASGRVSVFSQVTVKNHYVNGYIKPLFTDVKVYDAQKDAKKPFLHQSYELAIGGVAKLLKNRSTQQVAAKIDISGPVNTPNLSAWQAIGQFLGNAFINAIVPGFDREIAEARQARN